MLRIFHKKSFLALVLLFSSVTSGGQAETLVRLETDLGNVVIALNEELAPATTRYFLGYVDKGQYDGATIYRAASFDTDSRPQIVQGGVMFDALNAEGEIDPASFNVEYLHSPIESTDRTGLKHRRGAVSFARDLLKTGLVIPEIVFCLRDVPEMDANGRAIPDTSGFPVVGRVVSGLKVIEDVTLEALDGPTQIPFLKGQILSKPVVIRRAVRVPQDQANNTE